MSERRADDEAPAAPAPTRAELEARVDEARESLTQTVGQIKETVGDTVSGVLSLTDQFQKEPVAWSLGALSAGFAMGYSLGRAHHAKNTRGKPSPVARLADDVAREIASFGNALVSPELSAELHKAFGVDLRGALEHIAAMQTRPKAAMQTRPSAARQTRPKPQRLALAAPKRTRARPVRRKPAKPAKPRQRT